MYLTLLVCHLACIFSSLYVVLSLLDIVLSRFLCIIVIKLLTLLHCVCFVINFDKEKNHSSIIILIELNSVFHYLQTTFQLQRF